MSIDVDVPSSPASSPLRRHCHRALPGAAGGVEARQACKWRYTSRQGSAASGPTTTTGRSSEEAGGPRARHHDAWVLRCCRRRPVWEWMQRRGRLTLNRAGRRSAARGRSFQLREVDACVRVCAREALRL
ncbi:hypothetical protein HPB50_018576 [Hyalomma asiaticum]|uniref:Uncharacterized protein n=1 Tax=Hyalomma asiaticum TaxID=266040 RepID=A0ACB7SZS5_HYAAI|nr:hypothetical protein HPB50_018576 [Hyalomma asiaticum]